MRSVLFVAAVVVGGVLGPAGVSRAAAEKQPLTPREAVQRPVGEAVTVVFRVGEAYGLSGTVPVGVLPTFALAAEAGAGDPSFTVLVSGELVKVMDRFGVKYYNPGEYFKGKTIQVTGKLEVFPATKDQANSKPSYQLSVSQWESFRLLPTAAR
jgi:hypothetical protein